MTLPRAAAFSRYWRRHPPTHLLMAAWLGYKEPEKTVKDGGLLELLASMPGAVAEKEKKT